MACERKSPANWRGFLFGRNPKSHAQGAFVVAEFEVVLCTVAHRWIFRECVSDVLLDTCFVLQTGSANGEKVARYSARHQSSPMWCVRHWHRH